MNKAKKIIIISLIILIIVILSILTILINNMNGEIENYGAIDMNEKISEKEYNDGLYLYEYCNIKKCLQLYVDRLNTNSSSYINRDNNGKYISVSESIKKETIYNLLSKNYLENNNITVDNVYEYIKTMTDQKNVIPIKIKNISDDLNNTVNIQCYKVKSIVISTYNKEEFYYMYTLINIDNNKNTFSIEPIKNENDLEDLKIESNINVIEDKEVNTYIITSFKEEDLVKDYISSYKNIMLSNQELAYEYLNKEYKEKRFGNLENFKDYIRNNKEIIEKIRIDKYEVNHLENSTEYICQDQYGKYYIFNEKEILDYTVILDTYTIDLTQFISKYNSANSLEKVGYNINKIVEAINNKDYPYVYNKLSDEFKVNNYDNIEKFTKDIQRNLYNINELKIETALNEGNIYVYKIIISDKENNNNKKNMTIIMKLKEGTDFVMSFSYDDIS